MNKLIISLAALAALSTASIAGQRTDVDLRDRLLGDVNSAGDTAIGSNSSQNAALAILGNRHETAYELIVRLHREYEFSGH